MVDNQRARGWVRGGRGRGVRWLLSVVSRNGQRCREWSCTFEGSAKYLSTSGTWKSGSAHSAPPSNGA